MYHTTLQDTLVRMVFGHDMILNTPFVDYWESSRRCKQELIDKNNQHENKNRKPHNYRVCEKVPVCG